MKPAGFSAAFDQQLKQELIPFILRIRAEFGLPMVYVTHSTGEIMALFGEVVFLDKGSIAVKGRPSDFFVKQALPFTAQGLDQIVGRQLARE